MTTNPKYAHFHQRIIASFIDSFLFLTLILYMLSEAALGQSLAQVAYSLIIILLVMLSPFSIVYPLVFIKLFGATIGKIICGLEIVRVDGHSLSWKRIFFRQTIGYAFSSLFFGLGYLAMFKNEKRQTWHDQVVSTVVLEKRPTWIVGLVVLIGLIVAMGYFTIQTITHVKMNKPLQEESMVIFNQFKEIGEKEATPEATPKDSGPVVSQDILDDQARAYALIGEKKFNDASGVAEEMITESKTDIEKALAYQVKAEVLMNQNRFVEAKAPFLESLKLSDQLPGVYEGLAIVSINEKKYTAAKDYATKATSFEKPTAGSYYWLGVSYSYLKNNELAVSNLEKAVEMDPSNEFYKQELDAQKKQ